MGGESLRVFFKTFGCKANQYDTERMRQELEALGAQTAADAKGAHLCVVNSCTVTNQADADARRFIRRIRRENPEIRVVVAGCSSALKPLDYQEMVGVVGVVEGHDPVEVAQTSFLGLAGEEVSAFVPCALPPIDPPLVLDDDARALHQRAEQGVARLELASEMVPSVDWFVYAFVRKEAVVSSQIEGTQCTLIDLLNFEAETTNESPTDADVQEVCNYLDALAHARQQIASDRGLPISMRLLNETHGLLMHGVRGADKQPGEVRRSQNWIGGTRPGNASFVPPPPHLLSQVLAEFEEYIHAGDELPPLIRAGLQEILERGARGCILTGNPAYYTRFGFVLSGEHAPPGEPAEFFMVKLLGGSLPAGPIHFHRAFSGAQLTES